MEQKHLLTASEASEYLHVAPVTLRRWEQAGVITPLRTNGGHRRYRPEDLDAVSRGTTLKKSRKLTIGYCRVSTSGQKADLTRQTQVVTNYCEVNGYRFRIITDIGSGLNYHRRGLSEMISMICYGDVERVVVNYRDRLMRFGYEMFEQLCHEHHVIIETINETDEISDEQELVNDVLSIITVFSAKLYGKRSHRNKQIVQENQKLFIPPEAEAAEEDTETCDPADSGAEKDEPCEKGYTDVIN